MKNTSPAGKGDSVNITTGVDIERIARFERLLNRPAFMGGVYTEQERAYIAGKGAGTAAGLYCAKEAAAKALGRGLFGLLPREIEITHAAGGAPRVRLHGSARRQYGGRCFALSISHSGEYAVAFCVVTGE